MHGLGKKRSTFGKFIDKHGITQEEICEEAGSNKNTVSKACTEDRPKLREITKDALAHAARKLSGKPVYKDDFWPPLSG